MRKNAYPYGCHIIIELFTPEGAFVKVLLDNIYDDHSGAVGTYIMFCVKYRDVPMHVQARVYELKAPLSMRAINKQVKIELGILPTPQPEFMYLTYDRWHSDGRKVCWTQVKNGTLKSLNGKRAPTPFEHS